MRNTVHLRPLSPAARDVLVYAGLPGLPGSIRVDTTVTDDHRQGKKA